MYHHWSEVVNSACELHGVMQTELADVDRAVDVARSYTRSMRFPTLLEELQDDTLDGAALEADHFRRAEPYPITRTPAVFALTLAAFSLLYGEGDERETTIQPEQMEDGCRRVGLFVLIEKMRRMGVHEKVSLPFDPWDDETDTLIVTEGLNEERLNDFKRWLGYPVEENDA